MHPLLSIGQNLFTHHILNGEKPFLLTPTRVEITKTKHTAAEMNALEEKASAGGPALRMRRCLQSREQHTLENGSPDLEHVATKQRNLSLVQVSAK